MVDDRNDVDVERPWKDDREGGGWWWMQYSGEVVGQSGGVHQHIPLGPLNKKKHGTRDDLRSVWSNVTGFRIESCILPRSSCRSLDVYSGSAEKV